MDKEVFWSADQEIVIKLDSDGMRITFDPDDWPNHYEYRVVEPQIVSGIAIESDVWLKITIEQITAERQGAE